MQSQEDGQRLNLGATVKSPGVVFGVWAPHADAVAVIGEFNDWNEERHPCERREDGTWQVRLNSDAEVYGQVGEETPAEHPLATDEPTDGLPYSARVRLGSYSCLILSQDPPTE